MPGWYDKMYDGLLGPTTNYGGILNSSDENQARRAGQLALPASLLAASGYSDRPTTFMQAVGGAMQAGQRTQQNSLDAALQANLVKSQIARNERDQMPDAVRQYEYAKANGYKGSFDEWKRVAMPESAGPASIQEYNLYSQQTTAAGGTPEPFEKWLARRAQMSVGAPYMMTEVAGQRGPLDRRNGGFNPMSTVEQEASAAGEIAGAETGGKASATRLQGTIDAGLDAADALATVRRGQQLLAEVATGGLDAVKLKATNLFGVTGADEAELSANLGKAVLAQLRTTFGAAFTEKEGARLADIEAGFGKSTEGNKRLLEQAEKILDRAARRGLRAAQDSGDSFSADEITKSMNFTLDPAAPKPAPVAAPQTRTPAKPRSTSASGVVNWEDLK